MGTRSAGIFVFFPAVFFPGLMVGIISVLISGEFIPYKISFMAQKTRPGNSKAERGGDTTRSSSQGRKLSSGGNTNKKGNPEVDDATHSPVAGKGKEKRIGEKRRP